MRPTRLREIRWQTWRGVIARAARGFLADDCTDRAAALTYFGVLALFPSAIVVVALVGLVASGEDATDTIVDLIGEVTPSAMNAVRDRVNEVVANQDSAKFLLSFGLLGAVWSASGYVSAFTRAANGIYGVRETRPFYRLRPLQLLITVASLALLAIFALGLLVSGPVAKAVGDALGAGGAARMAWSIGRWPVLALVAGFLLSLLGWIAPNVQPPRLRWLTVGGVLTLVVWAVLSVGFGFYVANFSSYNATYGSLGAVVTFLVWLYLSNCAILFGVEINAELQRGRRLQAGEKADLGPALPPRERSDSEVGR
ncbi:MAG: YihY/virulence factor BrkB family protein [Micromonosporaceae bacterium]|jgi:membrane protein|nr:YihY/virulence factor BrkB family protein [Micromonosporaceae bacterium]